MKIFALVLLLPLILLFPHAAVTQQSSAQTTLNWAGAISYGSFSSITATFQIPTLKCGNGTVSIWAGLNDGSANLQQVGVEGACSILGPVWVAWYELLPDMSQQLPLAVNGGDIVTVAVGFMSGSILTLGIRDDSTGAAMLRFLPANSTTALTAECIVERYLSQPLADFGTLQFSECLPDAANFTTQPILMVDGVGGILAEATLMSGVTVTWLKS